MPSRTGDRWPRRTAAVALAAGLAGVLAAAPAVGQPRAPKPRPLAKTPTTSSPIVLAPDGRTVWVVRPDLDSIAVLRTDTNRLVRTIKVGDEPRAIAIEPRGRYAFVANAAGSSVTVLRIVRSTPRGFRAVRDRTITTGAEPWNIVASPDGRRVFVANSGQDTISVLDVATRRVIGNVDLRAGACNLGDRARHFQPRGMAVTGDSRFLLVTSFLAFTLPGGRQGQDTGKAGAVCRLRLATASRRIRDYRPANLIRLLPRDSGFAVDSTGDGVGDPTSAFPNQLQSIVISGSNAYLPNIAASPTGPLRFNVDTQAFLSVIDRVGGSTPADAGPGKFLNLHLGARNPEAGRKRLFFANVWAVAIAPRRGQGPLYGAGRGDAAYVVSAGSDLLVKVNINRATGAASFTEDADTTRYIDLNDPDNPVTSGLGAGKNPQGIVINARATRAWTFNAVSRNVSVVDIVNDRVLRTIALTGQPPAGSAEETAKVGAEVFFSSRGRFDRPAGTTVSTTDRLSSEGWQSCASCHFEGLTDGVVWQFGSGPRKSVPLNSTFSPLTRTQQRILNYSAIFDEVEDFEANIRNVSGPGGLAADTACATSATNLGRLDPNHGLLIGDDGTVNLPPCALNSLAAPANANRRQLTVTLPSSTVAVPALTAMREWVRLNVRTPNAPLRAAAGRPGPSPAVVNRGRTLFAQTCQSCHGGPNWTTSVKTFPSPVAAADIATERTGTFTGNPVGTPYLPAALRDIGSFGLGVPGLGNPIGQDVGADEKASATLTAGVAGAAPDALGRDYNADGKGVGFNVPSLLGINAVPPYYHNGACETLACVVGNVRHRTANGTVPDLLVNPADQARVVAFLQSVDGRTAPLP